MHRAECFSDSTHMLPSQPEGYLVSITTVKLQSSQDCLYWTLKPVFGITAVPSQRATIHRKIDTVIGSSSSKSVVKIILVDYSNSIFNLPPGRLKQKSVLGKGTDWCHSFTTYAPSTCHVPAGYRCDYKWTVTSQSFSSARFPTGSLCSLALWVMLLFDANCNAFLTGTFALWFGHRTHDSLSITHTGYMYSDSV